MTPLIDFMMDWSQLDIITLNEGLLPSQGKLPSHQATKTTVT